MKKYEEQIITKTQKAKSRLKGYMEIDDKYWFMNEHRIFGCDETLDYEPMNPPFGALKAFTEQIESCTYKIDLEGAEIDTKKKVFIIKTEHGFIGINPKYLKDMMRFCKTNVICIDPEQFKNGSYIGLIAAESTNKNIAICLPVHIEKPKSFDFYYEGCEQ